MRTTHLLIAALGLLALACQPEKKAEAPKPAIAWLSTPAGNTDTLKSVTLSPDSSAVSVLFGKVEVRVADKAAHDSTYTYTLTLPTHVVPKGKRLVAHARYAVVAGENASVKLAWAVPDQRSTPDADKADKGDKALATFRIAPAAGKDLVWKLGVHVSKPAGSGEVLFQWDSLDLATEK